MTKAPVYAAVVSKFDRVESRLMPQPSPLERLVDERFAARGVRVLLKRDDLVHPEIPGNKWRKLRLNLDEAHRHHRRPLLTFGGAYSNHLRAVAAAGHRYGLATVGVVRGEELARKPLNWSLTYCADRGMRLVFLDRSTYRRKHDPEVIERLSEEHGDFFLLPEGGSNALAVKGAMDIPSEIEVEYDVICCPVGTGGSLAGIAAGLPPQASAVGFSALKGGDFLVGEVARLQAEAGVSSANWRVETRFHFGGFAKRTPELDAFIADFERRHGLRLEWTYVAKMMHGIVELSSSGDIPAGATVVAVITGPATTDRGAGGT
ncbi:1-aminocyclopropane-1-carboxylate deaminase/D-cysteine desulfhydrase [Lipingzhangella halophila]|uniref:1-aminocyclopropane-1-carboxylate deaminase/D-cysteine desulfhydrase n=1 Tax=Lipingzhangella halophila TaxID=1783352 RepID=UPI0016073E43|nr:pyridoxal-phosphate dependent enzyme [Lipingzhangella halophila]